MCREQVSRKWRVNCHLTHSFGRKSLCRGRCWMTIRKMVSFTDGRWSECEVIRKMTGFTDGSTSGYGFVLKMAVLRMGAFQDGSDGDER